MKKPQAGFTIVELLIVIVVIAILATISIVAYNGVQARASQTAILGEVTQWRKLFEAYKAANGTYPSPIASGDPLTSGGPGSNMQNGYCLGTGFPEVSGTAYCYSVSSSSSYRVRQSTGTYLLSQISTIGTPPTNSKKYTYGDVTGPLLRYVSDTNVQLYTIFPSGTNCPSIGMQTNFSSADRVDCYYQLNYSN